MKPLLFKDKGVAICAMQAIMAIIVFLAFISGCCLRLNDLSAGTSYPVGASIATSNKSIIVEKFQWGNGNWTANGEAVVDDRNYPQGSGCNLNARNVNLNFQLDYPLQKLTLKFADLGGNSNIRVNNDFKNVSRMINLNGTSVGGVGVAIDAVQQGNNWYGQIKLNGTINDFAIGGQELWIDDICK